MTRRPKNPAAPAGPLIRTTDDVVSTRPVLWRIHRIIGRHALAFDELRTVGPLATARFDSHPLPRGEHPDHGVTYVALDVPTAVAEAFQTTRRVEATQAVALTSWTPTRPLRLLDLTGDWALRNGASHSLQAADRRRCRTWSRAVHQTWPDLDGLKSASTMTGRPVITLYNHAADSSPRLPAFSRPLDNPAVWTLIVDAAETIGYRLA